MELCSSNIKKILALSQEIAFPIFSQKTLFLYFLKRKYFLYLQKWNLALFSRSLKNKINAPRKKFFYNLGNQNPEKVSCVFSKESFSVISRKGNPEKKFIFQKTELSEHEKCKKPTLKMFFILYENKLFNHKLKKLFF